MNPSLAHAIVGICGSLLAGGARSVGVGKDLVASLNERESDKSGANLWLGSVFPETNV